MVSGSNNGLRFHARHVFPPLCTLHNARLWLEFAGVFGQVGARLSLFRVLQAGYRF
jgi:hypothetical protein